MGKISRSSKLLKEINNLEQNCSDTEYDESDLVESENEYPSSNSESPSESSDTDSEDEIDVCVEKVKESKFLKVKVIRMLKCLQSIKILKYLLTALCGKKLQEGSTPGRLPVRNIFKENVRSNGIRETTYYER